MKYILHGHDPVPCHDVLTWAAWLEHSDAERVVAQTGDRHNVEVSTVFIGIDHQLRNGPPVLFETLVFGGPSNGMMKRYSTWTEAETGHALIVGQVFKGWRGNIINDELVWRAPTRWERIKDRIYPIIAFVLFPVRVGIEFYKMTYCDGCHKFSHGSICPYCEEYKTR